MKLGPHSESRAMWKLIFGVLLLANFLFDFIPGLWAAADTTFVNGKLASLDGVSALTFTLCALYISIKMALDGLLVLMFKTVEDMRGERSPLRLEHRKDDDETRWM